MRLHTPRIQRPYYRNGPQHRAGADVSFGDIVKLFDFRAVKIGRWVNAAETQLAANLFFDAFCDLQSLLQVPPQVISLQGQLSLTFGSGGQRGVCAFYQPQGRLLALAKNAGGGSLAHEWFHAFDHYIASKMFQGASASAFASQLWLHNAPLQRHPLNQQLDQFFQAAFLTPSGKQPSPLFERSSAADGAIGRLYYSLPPELAARAFEKVLMQQALKNHFLVSGLDAAASLNVYPKPDELESLSSPLFRYFYWLGQALSNIGRS